MDRPLAVVANYTGDVGTPDGDSETGDVGINSECWMTARATFRRGRRPGCRRGKNEYGIIDTV
jgi:hypothetical protein